jgi:hypothetical protein
VRKRAQTRPKPKQLTQAVGDLWSVIYQLEAWAHDSDLRVSRPAFETLSKLVHDLLAWLLWTARLPTGSLGALLERLPENEAWETYRRGEHAAAWAGVELARLYKKIRAQLTSRSKRSVNPLRDLRCGFKLGKLDSPPNDWFRREYESKRDYRPNGQMVVWIARKIEEIRRFKSDWLYAGIVMAKSGANLESEIEVGWLRSKIVQGAPALKRLDDLPRFGDPDPEAFKAWQSFVRRQVLTQNQIINEFEELFPKQRKKLDGVIIATLRLAWRAAQGGGAVILPED